MENCNTENKKKMRTADEKRALMSRINRIAGQMNGIKRMLEEDRYCTEILIQLSAIEKAVKGLSCLLLEEHVRTCLFEKVQLGDNSAVEEIIELFRKFQ